MSVVPHRIINCSLVDIIAPWMKWFLVARGRSKTGVKGHHKTAQEPPRPVPLQRRWRFQLFLFYRVALCSYPHHSQATSRGSLAVAWQNRPKFWIFNKFCEIRAIVLRIDWINTHSMSGTENSRLHVCRSWQESKTICCRLCLEKMVIPNETYVLVVHFCVSQRPLVWWTRVHKDGMYISWRR